MTGYAVSSKETAAGTFTIEIKSVNSRFLDLQFRINDDFRALEPVFREVLSGKISRGKVECRFSFGKNNNNSGDKVLDATVLHQLARLQSEIHQYLPDASNLSVNELLRWPGVLQESGPDEGDLQAAINDTILQTVQAFILSREREGEALMATLIQRIQTMEEIVTRITPMIPDVLAQFQQKAIARLEEALGLTLGASGQSISRDEAMDRIRQEVTMYGIRIDVAEELSRLSAHLSETRQILKKGGQVGKRLDFMMQELNREANTLGSKAAIKELADASMELKLLIEQMREQVQNLE
jgi:uncharacterized protein (TIGR00255 family)